jgi:DNA-binding IclR family transcriptional regulator
MTQQITQSSIKYPEKGTRAAQLVAMLRRKQGATLGDIVKATAWKPHTARAALTGIRKHGFVIASDKPGGKDRIYRIAKTD